MGAVLSAGVVMDFICSEGAARTCRCAAVACLECRLCAEVRWLVQAHKLAQAVVRFPDRPDTFSDFYRPYFASGAGVGAEKCPALAGFLVEVAGGVGIPLASRPGKSGALRIPLFTRLQSCRCRDSDVGGVHQGGYMGVRNPYSMGGLR